jgi:hypothetical protein
LSREIRDISGEGLVTPEWQRSETKFAPLVLQAALLLAGEREHDRIAKVRKEKTDVKAL